MEVDIETPQASEITPIIPLQTTNLPPQIFRASTTTRRPYVTTTLGPVGHNHVQPSRSKFSISRSFHLDPTQAAGDSPFRCKNSYLLHCIIDSFLLITKDCADKTSFDFMNFILIFVANCL